jgi:hypothetical protein
MEIKGENVGVELTSPCPDHGQFPLLEAVGPAVVPIREGT